MVHFTASSSRSSSGEVWLAILLSCNPLGVVIWGLLFDCAVLCRQGGRAGPIIGDSCWRLPWCFRFPFFKRIRLRFVLGGEGSVWIDHVLGVRKADITIHIFLSVPSYDGCPEDLPPFDVVAAHRRPQIFCQPPIRPVLGCLHHHKQSQHLQQQATKALCLCLCLLSRSLLL